MAEYMKDKQRERSVTLKKKMDDDILQPWTEERGQASLASAEEALNAIRATKGMRRRGGAENVRPSSQASEPQTPTPIRTARPTTETPLPRSQRPSFGQAQGPSPHAGPSSATRQHLTPLSPRPMRRDTRRQALAEKPDPWQIGSRPEGSPASTQAGSAAFGPWDIDKELGLSPKSEGESLEEHWGRLQRKAAEAARKFREEERRRIGEEVEREERESMRRRRGDRASL